MTQTQTENQPNRRIYRGSCHCGAFIYDIDLPELRTVVECDCSFCRRTCNLYVPTDEDANFRVVNGSEENLTSYTFGPGSKIHKVYLNNGDGNIWSGLLILTRKFCPTCAMSMLSRMPNGPAHMRLVLNARALQNVDVYVLERKYIFNSRIGAQYQPPKHKGDMPCIVEGGQLYTGSCHCGAVTIALSCEPLEELGEERVVVCNCHICRRNAYVWLFPKAENVILSGSEDDIGRYTFPEGLTSKTFCRACGVGMTYLINQPIEDRVLAPNETPCRAYRKGDTSHPVNARVLHGVEVGKVEGAAVMPA